MDARLPAHLEVAGLIRQVQAAGGFAAVLRKGDRDAGAILLVLTENGTDTRLFERLPDPAKGRVWACSAREDVDDKGKFQEYLTRRTRQDSDAWVVELDIAQGERFIGNPAPAA